MPIKNFFSGRKPEENDAAPKNLGNDDVFGDDFGGMQSLDMYADEDSAAGGFAALLQPDDEFAIQDENQVYYEDDGSFEETGDGQNVGEAVFQNLFAQDGNKGQDLLAQEGDDFFAAQPDSFAQEGDDFFAAQPDSFAQEGDDFFAAQPDGFAQEGDDFFAAQPNGYDSTTVQGDDFFAAQPLDAGDGQNQQAGVVFEDTTYQLDAAGHPIVDAAYRQQMPAYDANSQAVEMPQDVVIPFDIAVPEQSFNITPEEPEITFLQEQADLEPKRKYAPVFPQPIPSALDELRAGIVRPASPISAIAATQIPVVVTAADAAAADAASRAAVETAAVEAAVQEQAAREEAERAAVEVQAAQYGYEDPTPAQMGFGYTAPVQDNAYGYDPASNGAFSAEEFHLPVTEDVPAWSAPEAEDLPLEHTFVQDDVFVREQPPQNPKMFDYDYAPIEGNESQQYTDAQTVANAPQGQEYVNAFERVEEYPTAQSPQDYASNLQAMFNSDDTYAAVDAVEQPFDASAGYEAPAYDVQSFDTATFDAPAFEGDGFGTDSFDSQPFAEDAFADAGYDNETHDSQADYAFEEEQGDLYASDVEAPSAEFNLPDEVDSDAFYAGDEDNVLGFAQDDTALVQPAAFNPFESEEWLDEAAHDEVKKSDRSFGGDNGGDRKPPSKKKKSGGTGKSNLPLILVLVVLLLLIVGVVAALWLGGKGEQAPQSSSVAPSIAPVSSSSEPLPPVPEVDPIPRDEWYMKLVNRQNVLAADFKVETKNSSDGIPVDSRIVDALNQMITDGNATGLKLTTASGYRTHARQKTNYEHQVGQQVAAGKSQADAEAAAALITAPPGASEHNLGLAVDIMSKTFKEYESKYEETAEAKWLFENAANYGFILRYPKTAQAVTGFEYEPWHYRYVGVDQAKRVKASGLTLEEYLAQDAPTGIPTAGDTTQGEPAASDAADASAQSVAGASSSAAAQ